MNRTKNTRYALCGLSTRGVYHFALPLLGLNLKGGTNFNDHAELVAILDIDPVRVEAFLNKIERKIPFYHPDEFARMIEEARPDTVLIVGPDNTHAGHIIKALESGCEVIVEKPMVINTQQIREVQAAEKRTGRSIRVAFNLRYTPTHQHIKRMILEGDIGRITNVELAYNLDTKHGSSYFLRWNREQANSGSLAVHKCCHHFDLINWFLGDTPEWVFAFGALNYYGKDGALRPRDAQGTPLDSVEEKRQCPIFAKHYADTESPETDLLLPAGDGYDLPFDVQYPKTKRRYIYDENIDIKDTYSMVAHYRGGASLSYSCNFCTPWEGYRLGINGTKGRIEVDHHSNPDPTGITTPADKTGLITFYPLFGGKQVIEVSPAVGGHGGGDFVIQRDLFDRVSDESRELKLVAGSNEGAISVAMGEAVTRSITETRPINIQALLAGKEETL